jgi:hypothetical protein
MSCEQFCLPAALTRKEWTYVNCQTVSCQKLINGSLSFPADPAPNGDYILHADQDQLTLVSTAAAMSFFQGVYEGGPYQITSIQAPLRFTPTDATGDYEFNPATYEITFDKIGTYKIDYSTTLQNAGNGSDRFYHGFLIDELVNQQLSFNQAGTGTFPGDATVVNSIIYQMDPGQKISLYGKGLVNTWNLNGTIITIQRLG